MLRDLWNWKDQNALRTWKISKGSMYSGGMRASV